MEAYTEGIVFFTNNLNIAEVVCVCVYVCMCVCVRGRREVQIDISRNFFSGIYMSNLTVPY